MHRALCHYDSMIRNYLYIYMHLYAIITTTRDIKARSNEIYHSRYERRRPSNFGPRIDIVLIALRASPTIIYRAIDMTRYHALHSYVRLNAARLRFVAARFSWLARDIHSYRGIRGCGVKRDGLIQ